jgi:hypothetical protein
VTPPFKVFVQDICWQHYSEENINLQNLTLIERLYFENFEGK